MGGYPGICNRLFGGDALACIGDKGRSIVTAALRTAFDQDTLAGSKEHWTKLIVAFQPRHPKLAELMLRSEEDVLADKGSARSRLKRSPGAFPRRRSPPQVHWRQIHSTSPLERFNKEIKRRTNVVGMFPNDAVIRHFVGALMLE